MKLYKITPTEYRDDFYYCMCKNFKELTNYLNFIYNSGMESVFKIELLAEENHKIPIIPKLIIVKGQNAGT